MDNVLQRQLRTEARTQIIIGRQRDQEFLLLCCREFVIDVTADQIVMRHMRSDETFSWRSFAVEISTLDHS
jgi:hypothetical protein